MAKQYREVPRKEAKDMCSAGVIVEWEYTSTGARNGNWEKVDDPKSAAFTKMMGDDYFRVEVEW